MKKLPIGTQDFSILREDDYLYVDKTEHIFKLVENGRIYFLSRPRRFGKSLLISTIEELFKCNKKLFEDLYIYNKWDWTKPYPVLSLDLSGSEESENIHDFLNDILEEASEDFNVELKRITLNKKFKELIKKVSLKTGEKVVVLIDKYDDPIIKNLKNPEIAEKIRNTLNSFYKALKESDSYIKFLFLTGISKFSNVSIFSALNNPDDITLSQDFSTICGYTQDELQSNFSSHIENLIEKQGLTEEETLNYIKFWYDGYSWNGVDKVYNPFSTLKLFKENSFDTHWFETGTPKFLTDFSYNIETILEPVDTIKSDFDDFDPLNISQNALLFQTGYLTIKNVDENKMPPIYRLNIPNFEVRRAFFNNLVSEFSNVSINDLMKYRKIFWESVLEGDEETIKEIVGDYLAPIPNILRSKEEKYYHALIFRWLLSMGFNIHCEVLTYSGRVDAVIEKNNKIIIIEFKQDNERSIDEMIKESLQQIEDRKYEIPYKGKTIIRMAIVFSKEKIGCKIEKDIF
ncbi:MAG: ATP-binding protein [Methanobrevibacter sp.]|jgi:hypothetical protein|nr:ATP-binding protein [Candidatus Methanovirga procula]